MIYRHNAAYAIQCYLLRLDPDFTYLDVYSFLSENCRDPYSGSAIKSGHPRGNSLKFGRIPITRGKKNRALYEKDDIRAFILKVRNDPVYREKLISYGKSTA